MNDHFEPKQEKHYTPNVGSKQKALANMVARSSPYFHERNKNKNASNPRKYV